jgi:hypothetical protein
MKTTRTRFHLKGGKVVDFSSEEVEKMDSLYYIITPKGEDDMRSEIRIPHTSILMIEVHKEESKEHRRVSG